MSFCMSFGSGGLPEWPALTQRRPLVSHAVISLIWLGSLISYGFSRSELTPNIFASSFLIRSTIVREPALSIVRAKIARRSFKFCSCNKKVHNKGSLPRICPIPGIAGRASLEHRVAFRANCDWKCSSENIPAHASDGTSFMYA
jgi:hypothetical protein